MKKAPKPSPKLLAGKNEKARDHLLGLALRVEEKVGPQGLAEVLNEVPQGNARQFARRSATGGEGAGGEDVVTPTEDW